MSPETILKIVLLIVMKALRKNTQVCFKVSCVTKIKLQYLRRAVLQSTFLLMFFTAPCLFQCCPLSLLMLLRQSLDYASTFKKHCCQKNINISKISYNFTITIRYNDFSSLEFVSLIFQEFMKFHMPKFLDSMALFVR